MTDRELLEMAAKAAGIQLNGASIAPIYMGDDGQWVRWNPLEDDGDALRLAVQLQLIVAVDGADLVEVSYPLGDRNDPFIRCCEPIGEDRFAATRRAIVRAAVAIAENGVG